LSAQLPAHVTATVTEAGIASVDNVKKMTPMPAKESAATNSKNGKRTKQVRVVDFPLESPDWLETQAVLPIDCAVCPQYDEPARIKQN